MNAAERAADAVDEDDVVRLDAEAVRASAKLVSRITDADLGRATPCAGWTLNHLLAHMTSQHHGFAAAAAGDGADPRHWADEGADGAAAEELVAGYLRAADSVVAAFAGAGVLDRGFCVLPISATTQFPARQAIAFHLVDYVTHGWDVARSLGLPYELPPDVLDTTLKVALTVPDGEARRTSDASFAPRIPGYEEAAALNRIVALLGRHPNWASEQAALPLRVCALM